MSPTKQDAGASVTGILCYRIPSLPRSCNPEFVIHVWRDGAGVAIRLDKAMAKNLYDELEEFIRSTDDTVPER